MDASKACELGVTKIVPFVSKNTVVKLDEKKAEKKQSRWNEILLAATKQCNRNTLVELEPVIPLKNCRIIKVNVIWWLMRRKVILLNIWHTI